MIDSGVIGKGLDQDYKLLNGENVNSLGEEETYKPWQSGSNVFSKPNRIKMITTLLKSKSVDFVHHYGRRGMKLYNKLTTMGRDEQIRIAGEVWGCTIPT